MNPSERFIQARDFLLDHREDYDRAYRDFVVPEFETFNWALDYFDVHAANNVGTALWIVEEDGSERKLSFAEMSERSNQTANFFRSLGAKRGDRMLMMLGNQLELWETMLAAIKLGLVIIPASPLATRRDLLDMIGRGAVTMIVTNAADVSKFNGFAGFRICVGEAANWVSYLSSYRESALFIPDGVTRANDPLLLYFTSGTTSAPKLVLHTHTSYPVGHLSTMYWIGLRPGDIHCNISSPGWAKHAWSSFFAPWNAGATVFVYNYSRFDAPKTLRVIETNKVTTMCAPPTVWRMVIQEPLEDYTMELREIVSAGEPLNPEIIEQIAASWGLTIRDGYGQTETTAQIGNSPGQRLKPGSMGRLLPGYSVALLDSSSPSGDTGEVAIDISRRPIGLMIGYEDDPAKNAEVMRDGFYYTGDIASRDEAGYIKFVGRSDDIFKSSDYRISPFELESVLLEHEAVAEAAVVPSPDDLRLSVPKAFVALAAGHQPDREKARSIIEHCRERLAPYKRIRRIEFAELPKTLSGKIRRVELRSSEAVRGSKERKENEFWEEDVG